MGAPPKVNPVRRNARVGPRQLPVEGRKGPVPPWPLGAPRERASAERELAIWRDAWSTPQAVEWERLGWTRVVARYCRVVAAAELLDRECIAEARQLEDRLGLTPKSMRLLLWEIAVDEVAEKRDERTASARGRIKAVG